jgi:hypothetical protein
MATPNVDAWTTLTAVSGRATVVTAVPRLLIVDPVQNRQNPPLRRPVSTHSATEE